MIIVFKRKERPDQFLIGGTLATGDRISGRDQLTEERAPSSRDRHASGRRKIPQVARIADSLARCTTGMVSLAKIQQQVSRAGGAP
jgi:hypothetical protein